MSLLAAAFLGAGGLLLVQHVAIISTWRPVLATVVRSEVVSYRHRRQHTVTMHRGEIELEYSAGGRTYRTPESFRHASSNESSIRRRMETTYAVGTRHEVFYDPQNPHAVRWNVGWNLDHFLLPLAFALVGVVLSAVCVMLWRLPYPPKRSCSLCRRRAGESDTYCATCGAELTPSARRRGKQPPQQDRAATENDRPAMWFLLAVLFGLPGLAALAGALYLGATTYIATRTWPTVEARVTGSRIAGFHGSEGRASYRLWVEFEFPWNGERRRSSAESPYSSYSYAWIARRQEEFAPGGRHTIRVHPQLPQEIRFDTENSLRNWLPVAGLGLFGAIFASLGGVLLRQALARRCIACRHRLIRQAAFCTACGAKAAEKEPQQGVDAASG